MRPLPAHATLARAYRPAGKRAFAAVGYPGIAGVLSGKNDAGLVVADLTVTAVADGAVPLDPGGVPYATAWTRSSPGYAATGPSA